MDNHSARSFASAVCAVLPLDYGTDGFVLLRLRSYTTMTFSLYITTHHHGTVSFSPLVGSPPAFLQCHYTTFLHTPYPTTTYHYYVHTHTHSHCMEPCHAFSHTHLPASPVCHTTTHTHTFPTILPHHGTACVPKVGISPPAYRVLPLPTCHPHRPLHVPTTCLRYCPTTTRNPRHSCYCHITLFP